MSSTERTTPLWLPAVCFVVGAITIQKILLTRRKAQETTLHLSILRGTPSKQQQSVADRYARPYEHERKMTNRLEDGSGDESDGIERTKVVVRVPATSANMGPGFDAIGMAVDMWSTITVERSDKFEIICEGEGSHDMPLDETNLVCSSLCVAFKKAGKPVPLLKYHLVNRIPYARGLGSSSAAIVGGLLAGCVLAGHRVPTWGSEELLNMAAEIEGHPDNVAPALYGGIQLGIHTGTRWMTERVNMPPGLQCVCFIPNTIGKTSTARGVLSDTITRKEAVFNIGRVAWLINALASNNIDQLRYGVEDALHQPQRGAAVYPHLYPIIEAAVEAGANAAYLSGAGNTHTSPPSLPLYPTPMLTLPILTSIYSSHLTLAYLTLPWGTGPTVMAITSGASGDIFTQRAKERVDKKVAEAMLAAAEKCGTVGQGRGRR